MKQDLIKIIKAFDSFLDDMYDRGAYDLSDQTYYEIEKLVLGMKNKYL